MAMIKMILRKMLKNKALVACLTLGIIVAVGLITSIPLYTQAVLQKSLIKEMENYQNKEQKFPGNYILTLSQKEDSSIINTMKELDEKDENIYKDNKVIDFYNKRLKSFLEVDNYVSNNAKNLIGLPVLSKLKIYSTDNRIISVQNSKGRRETFAKIVSVSDIENHIKLVDGKLPSKTPSDGVYEVLVSEAALNKLNLLLGSEIILNDTRGKSKLDPIKVKPVGIFSEKLTKDIYWGFKTSDSFDDCFIIDEQLMKKDFIEKQPTLLRSTQWLFAFDYHAFKTGELSNFTSGSATLEKNVADLSFSSTSKVEAPCTSLVYTYLEKSKKLTQMLFSLYVPITIMLFLYLFMVSRLIITREKNEISLLSSRGAKRYQIVIIYLIEGLIIGVIALIIGPMLGYLLTSVVGASGGFLEFTSRKALPIVINKTVFLYAGVTILLSILALIVPAYIASKTTIVNLKQGMARKTRFSLWEKLFIDIILLLLSGYGYYSFTERQKIMKATGLSSNELSIDPLLFLVPVLFIIGLQLFLLRFYPYIIKLIYWIGKKVWTPSIYASLLQIGRSMRTYHFLMIFLVMTLSIGIFSAASARTINLNEEEKIKYKNGSDMVITPVWERAKEKHQVIYEPHFAIYTQLLGVESATRVFYNENVYIDATNKNINNSSLMAIDPYEFSKTAWFRTGLLPSHINNYLNLLNSEPSACLISSSLSQTYGIKTGDTLRIRLSEEDLQTGTFTVYGIINYWPSWNPNKNNSLTDAIDPMLVVTNLQYIQDHLSIKPYNVWLKLKPDANSTQVYDSIKKNNLVITYVENTKQQLIERKNDPFQLAFNGALTLSFVISGFICFLGFLIYWILSIKSRTLQFGIFRAMGLSTRQLISMITFEQIATSAAAIIAGIFIGIVTSRIFVHFFEISFDAYSQVPPFRVVSYPGDRLKIYILVGIMLSVCLAVLGYILSRLKVNQAIKLGED